MPVFIISILVGLLIIYLCAPGNSEKYVNRIYGQDLSLKVLEKAKLEVIRLPNYDYAVKCLIGKKELFLDMVFMSDCSFIAINGWQETLSLKTGYTAINHYNNNSYIPYDLCFTKNARIFKNIAHAEEYYNQGVIAIKNIILAKQRAAANSKK